MTAKTRIVFRTLPLKRSAEHGPLALTFPSCAPPSRFLEPSSNDKMLLKLYRPSNESRVDAAVVASTERIGYVGSPLQGYSGAIKYLLCIYDTEEKSGRIVECGKPLQMKQYVKATLDKEKKKDTARSSILEARTDLTNTFGTRKKQKEQRQLQANKVSGQMVVGLAALEEDLLSKSKEVDLVELPSGSSALPQHNTLASCASDAGTSVINEHIANIFNDETIKKYRKIAKKPSEIKKLRQDNSFGEFFLYHLEKSSLLSKTDQRERIRLLLHLASLVSFYRLPRFIKRKREELAEELGFPEALLKSHFHQFTSKEGTGKWPVLTDERKTKLIFHILVLCLHLEHFHLSADRVAQDLKMQAPKCAQYLRELGCAVVKSRKRKSSEESSDGSPKSEGYIATLPLPLTFPKLRRGKK